MQSNLWTQRTAPCSKELPYVKGPQQTATRDKTKAGRSSRKSLLKDRSGASPLHRESVSFSEMSKMCFHSWNTSSRLIDTTLIIIVLSLFQMTVIHSCPGLKKRKQQGTWLGNLVALAGASAVCCRQLLLVKRSRYPQCSPEMLATSPSSNSPPLPASQDPVKEMRKSPLSSTV